MKASEIIERVVGQIIAEIEAGALPWSKPWTNTKQEGRGLNLGGFALPLRSTGEAYRGINVLSLWIAAAENGFKGRYWFTFRQAQNAGGQIKKGSKASGVIYADQAKKEETNDAGETVEKTYAFLKAYAVFNSDQIEGLPEKFYAKMPEQAEQIEQPAAAVEAVEIPGKEWLATIPATIRHGGNRAYFSPAADFVQMPQAEQFKTPMAYTSTLLHELVHWTGHKSRLDRTFGARFGDHAYAMEELVAELGSAFGAANLGVMTDSAIREDHAPYLASWLKVLKADPRALVSAAAKASQAIDHLDAYSRPAAAAEEVQIAA
jgi:antirestriction protein ArdC